MAECNFRYPASVLAGQARLTAEDIVLLRRHMFPRGLMSDADARQLLALHRSTSEKFSAWDNWFVEMMTAFIVVHSYPQHSLDELNAEWLAGLIAEDGIVATPAELEIVLHAMEMACAVPDLLSALALDQLRLALESGDGAYAAQRRTRRTGIAAEDIEFVYRILRGSLYDGKMLLSGREVAVLDRIDALVGDTFNHPAWHDLISSISVRTVEGQASARPWLRMQIDDIVLDDVA
jgi:hypothetical protein